MFVFPGYFECWMFDVHHKCSPHVSSFPSFLCFCLSSSLPCFTEDSQKGERCRVPFLWSSTWLLISFPLLHLLLSISHILLIYTVQYLLSFISSFFFHLNFSLISSQHFWIHLFSSCCSCVCLHVGLVHCLTLPFLPAVLSGVFQTFGACQEPPGLARLSSFFIPIRSNTGTQSSVSPQQQPQD